MPQAPSYRLATPRLVLRCWDPSDAPALREAIGDSLEELRRFMPWAADEPLSVEEKAAWLRGVRARFDLDEEWLYAVVEQASGRLVGGAGLHVRHGSLEIGYWIRTGSTGRGFATEAAGALAISALRVHGACRVEIRCDPRHLPSARVAEKLGFRHEALLRCADVAPDGGRRDTAIWTLLSEDISGAPVSSHDVEGTDCLGGTWRQQRSRSDG